MLISQQLFLGSKMETEKARIVKAYVSK